MSTFIFSTLFFLLLLLIFLYFLTYSKETFVTCQKWIGDLQFSPANICKDCGYPIDCHGPRKGESWRHIFQTESL
jgi:hypothetical protein